VKTEHNYGHGGSGWSVSWGSGAIATANALATGERDIAGIDSLGNRYLRGRTQRLGHRTPDRAPALCPW
jgi:hypothetical protein